MTIHWRRVVILDGFRLTSMVVSGALNSQSEPNASPTEAAVTDTPITPDLVVSSIPARVFVDQPADSAIFARTGTRYRIG